MKHQITCGLTVLMLAVCLIGTIVMLSMLAGCTTVATQDGQLGKFVQADADSALALAKANNDTPGVTCFTSVGAALKAINAVPFSPGLLYLSESARVTKQQEGLVAAACAGLLTISVMP